MLPTNKDFLGRNLNRHEEKEKNRYERAHARQNFVMNAY